MDRKDNPPQGWREENMESADTRGTAEEQSDSRDALLGQALAKLAAHTSSTLPPEDFEARLLARAEEQALLQPAGAAPADEPRRVSAFHRLAFRWAWASIAFAAIAFAFWIGVPREPRLPAEAGLEAFLAGAEARVENYAGDRAAPNPPREETAGPALSAQVARRTRPKQRQLVARTVKPSDSAPAEPVASVDESARETPRPRYSEFIPLEFAPMFPADEAWQTVRVRIGAEDFLRWSLPGSAIARATQLAHNGRVTADLLVGDDGSPRAIRLVSLDE